MEWHGAYWSWAQYRAQHELKHKWVIRARVRLRAQPTTNCQVRKTHREVWAIVSAGTRGHPGPSACHCTGRLPEGLPNYEAAHGVETPRQSTKTTLGQIKRNDRLYLKRRV